jgi:predicted kinase
MLYDDASIQGDWAVIVAVVEQQLRQAAQAIVQQRSPFAIYDATNAVPQHRCDAITLARACGFTSVIGIWFNVSQSTCLARNQHRSRQVPQAVIAQMQQALRQAPPQLPEGFDRILKIESEKLVPN